MNGKNYPIGHKKYGSMGPMTEQEAMSLPMGNKTIAKFGMLKAFKQLLVKDVEMVKKAVKKMIYKPGKQ